MSYNGQSGYTAIVGTIANGSVGATVHAIYATATGTGTTAKNGITLSISNTGINYTWYPVLLIEGTGTDLVFDKVRYAGVGTTNYNNITQATAYYDVETSLTTDTPTPMSIVQITDGSQSTTQVKKMLLGGKKSNTYWAAHCLWTADRRDYQYKLTVTVGTNALNEEHYVYFVKQIG